MILHTSAYESHAVTYEHINRIDMEFLSDTVMRVDTYCHGTFKGHILAPDTDPRADIREFTLFTDNMKKLRGAEIKNGEIVLYLPEF
jgi:hypothetical protein